MASVIHGFIYNKAAFEELGLDAADDRGRVLRRPRQDQGGRHLHPDGDGHQRPVGSRDHGLPEHRPELLEGRGRPARADRGRAEADRRRTGSPPSREIAKLEGLPRRRLRGADLPRQPEPLHPRPRRDLPGRLLGDRALPRPDRRRLRDGRLPAAGPGRGRRLLHLRPRRHRHRPERRLAERRRGEGLPRMGRLGRVRPALRQRAARLLPAAERAGRRSRTRWRRSSSPGARPASRRSARPTRSCRAARRTSRTRPGTPRPTSSAAPRPPRPPPQRLQDGLATWYEPQQN